MEQQSRLAYAAPKSGVERVPTVDVIIVNSRGDDHPWFQAAMQSCQQQGYPCVGQMVVYNNDKALTIGQAYNLGAANSNADFVLFVGDDDLISVDLVSHLVDVMTMVRRHGHPKLAMVTGFCTLIDMGGKPLSVPERSVGNRMELKVAQVQHTGMFDRAWLVANPFNEVMHRGVGREMHHRMLQQQQATGDRLYWAVSYHYGYHFRQHIGMVSGENHALRKA